MRITFRGHAFFELETATGLRIVVDPFHQNPFTKVQPSQLRPDLLLLTHGHGDHLGCAVEIDAPTLAIYEMTNFLARRGVRKAIGMNLGGTYRTEGVAITMVPAQHSSGIDPGAGGTFDGYGGSSAGFIIDDGDQRFYHLGDTALFGDLRTVVRDVYGPTIAAVPIGDLYTMGPRYGAIATAWCGVSHAIPIHYNTFPAIAQDPQDFVAAVAKEAPKTQVHVMEGDTSLEL